MDFDVAVIGAGPMGSYAADMISKKGWRVALIEEHRKIGVPVQCAGLVTPRVFELVDKKLTVVNRIRGAEIYSPSGRELLIDGKETKAVVLDRAAFDREIAKDALFHGASSFLGSTALKAERRKDGIELSVQTPDRLVKVNCKILIGADGIRSNVAKWFGLPRAESIVKGFEAELVEVDCNPRFAKIFVGNDVAPGFFSWIIPSGETTRVGLCVEKGSAYNYFNKMFQSGESSRFLKNSRTISFVAGAIPFGLLRRTVADNVMIVGDAACQAKASTGGGVYTGLVASKLCADTALLALEADDFSERFLKRYHRNWKKAIGKELKRGLFAHKIYSDLTDKQLEELFDLLDNEKILNLISEKGDMTFPSNIGKHLLKKEPRFLKYVTPAIKALFR
ncbi:MAG: NAD(P)/FAD-dependent oxidoreductase [Methanomassiliicoccales archaeon]|nr:MAG: NAD(P)/FAD-dependent oxidoreductase [Methanomassiliicoccales archaeon]